MVLFNTAFNKYKQGINLHCQVIVLQRIICHLKRKEHDMNCNAVVCVCWCVRVCLCARTPVSSGLCLFLAHPKRFRIYSALLLGYKSIHKHPWSVQTLIWFTVVIKKRYPFLPRLFMELK